MDYKSVVHAIGITQDSTTDNTRRLLTLVQDFITDDHEGRSGSALLDLDLSPCYQVAEDHDRYLLSKSAVRAIKAAIATNVNANAIGRAILNEAQTTCSRLCR